MTPTIRQIAAELEALRNDSDTPSTERLARVDEIGFTVAAKLDKGYSKPLRALMGEVTYTYEVIKYGRKLPLVQILFID